MQVDSPTRGGPAACGTMRGGGRCEAARRRSGLGRIRPRRRGKVDCPTSPLQEARAGWDGAALLGDATATPKTITKTLEAMAPLLWSPNFKELLAAEVGELAKMGVLQGAASAKDAAPRSRYFRRGKTKKPEKRAELEVRQMRDAAAAAVRQGNQQTYPLSICARSVAMLMRRSNTFDWAEMLNKRLVLSKPTAFKLVKLMMACKPKVEFRTMRAVAFHIFDQCYKKKGKSRGEHRAAERVDASGDLVDLISMVIINSVTLHIPESLCGGISPQLEAKLIAEGLIHAHSQASYAC